MRNDRERSLFVLATLVAAAAVAPAIVDSVSSAAAEGRRPAAADSPAVAAAVAATGATDTASARKRAAEAPVIDGWRAPEVARGVPNPIDATPESVARGRALFEGACVRCHGPQGHGDGKMARMLAKKPAALTQRLPGQSDGEIFWKIGAGKSPMPVFKKDLKPEQIWDVVNFLRMVILSPEALAPDAAHQDSASAPAAAAPAGAARPIEGKGGDD